MKQHFVIASLLVMVLPGISHAQCHFYRNERVDSISGLPVKIQKSGATSVSATAWTAAWLNYSTNRKWIHLNLSIKRDFGRILVIDYQEPITMTFDDSTTLTVYPSEAYSAAESKFNFDFLSSQSVDLIVMEMTRAQIQILATKNLKSIGFYAAAKKDLEKKGATSDPFPYHEIKIRSIMKNRIKMFSECILRTN